MILLLKMLIYVREFSKSLIDITYTCYVNLKPGMVHDWQHLLFLFNVKFFYAEAKFSLPELSCIPQLSWKGLNIYLKRFHDKALDYCNPVEEEVLVNIFLQ